METIGIILLTITLILSAVSGNKIHCEIGNVEEEMQNKEEKKINKEIEDEQRKPKPLNQIPGLID